MTWAQRLKRIFGIDIETCAACGGAVRIIACIEDPDVIEKILTQLDKNTTEPKGPWRSPAGLRRSAVCSIDRDDPATTLRGCADCVAATMPAGRMAGASVKSAPASLSLRQVRAP
jgi:23S rRNA U2552 (ribose-2'-O)-methylase RlmE/FtsJ